MRSSAVALATSGIFALVACGSRVAVGFVDGPEPSNGLVDGGALLPPFVNDGALPEADPPTPGCDTKNCADLCAPLCEGDAASCPPPRLFHVCNGLGECLPEQPACVGIQAEDGGEPPSYVPCAGLACGARCLSSCVQGTAGCTSPSVGVCHADGSCSASPSACP